MGTIVRFEFLGNRWMFLALCLSIFGIPFAILYLLATLVVVHEDMENPNLFVEQWRTGHRPAP